MATCQSPLLGLAILALGHYAITPAPDTELRLIRHNENAAFEVDDRRAGRKYLLRCHQPASRNMLGIQHTFEGLSAEMEILRAFRCGTGIPLQQPVSNNAGLFVTGEEDPAAPSGGTVPCTLLTWVEGDALDAKHPRLPGAVPEMARTVARMHQFARAWQPEAPLPRPIYDYAKYRYLVDQVGAGARRGVLEREHYDIILETMRHIEAVFAAAPRTPETWGIIHADLGPGNWVLADGPTEAGGDAEACPVPIDWCFCGYGPYLFDVGGTLPGLQPGQRRAYLDGYQREEGELSPSELRFCDACFILSVLGAVGFHISNPSSREWITRRMPWWTGQYCRLFLAGQSPLLADE